MPRDLAASFRINLKRLREAHGLSYRQMEEASGVSASAVSLLEKGDRANPGLDTLAALAAALKVSPEMMITPHTEQELQEAATRTILTTAEEELLRRWRALPQRKQALVAGYLDRIAEEE